jgi:hypothetical protein
MVVRTWADLQARVEWIIGEITADAALTAAAAANPLLALEELGIVIDATARDAIADRLRYGPARSVRVRRLRERVRKAFGQDIDPEDEDSVRGIVLEENLGSSSSDLDATLHEASAWHPGAKSLLELRSVVASAPGFAPRSTYQAIRTGDLSVPISNLRIRFKDQVRPRKQSERT